MQLRDWIKKYAKEAEPFNLADGFKIHFEQDKGFICYRVKDDIFEIDHTCTTDIRYFRDMSFRLTKELGCHTLRVMTMRNPASYVRVTKTHLNLKLSGIRPNGKWYWVFEWYAEELIK
ncbi:hypothetical protein [Pectinatus frisingensis]|uniref:hypothetical protein n=1 Tax=Pectinatus frisingensis TaxID=865 RepID=UPI0018C676C6|nr:hypothetical protein [Pectinatus frisingensis]